MTDRSARRCPIAAPLRSNSVDVGEEDAVRGRSVANPPAAVGRHWIVGNPCARLDAGQCRDESRTDRLAAEPVAVEPFGNLVESVCDVRWRLVVARRGLQGEARGDRHPPLAALLAVPASRLVGRGPCTGRIPLGETDFSGGHENAGHLDLVAVHRQHFQGPIQKGVGVVEQGGVGEHLGMV